MLKGGGGCWGQVETVNFKRSCRAPVKKPVYTWFPLYFGTCRRDLKKKDTQNSILTLTNHIYPIARAS